MNEPAINCSCITNGGKFITDFADGIRTVAIWCRGQLLFQLSHHHYRQQLASCLHQVRPRDFWCFKDVLENIKSLSLPLINLSFARVRRRIWNLFYTLSSLCSAFQRNGGQFTLSKRRPFQSCQCSSFTFVAFQYFLTNMRDLEVKQFKSCTQVPSPRL